MLRRRMLCAMTVVIVTAITTLHVGAEETLKLAIGQRGNWNTAVAELGQRGGIFKRHGLVLDILYTSGGGETQQVIIAAETTGGADFWYASTTSPIKTLKDTNGRTIAFSTVGSSTQSVVLAFIRELGLKAKPVATGNPVSTLTQVMTEQIDVGWASPPFGFKEIDEGKIRVVARATDLAMVRGQTIRLLATTASVLEKRRDAIQRFMAAYRESLVYIYSDNPKVIADFAEFAGISEDVARRTRDGFSKEMLQPDEVKGLDVTMPEAVTLKYLPAPLTSEQLRDLIQIPPPPRS
jgi:NitT/TauT family transport system substrate-binding protein